MIHKVIYFVILFLFLSHPIFSQKKEIKQRTFMLTGASFAVPVNGWFELGCEEMGVTGINRAKGGTAIADMANLMADGALYSARQLEELDALVIMHVVNKDVFDETKVRDSYLDYQTPFDRSNYAIAFDYVIKRYLTECYNLKFNPNSKYCGSKAGKPAIIVLCTDWHDGRAVYNTTVRKLAAKWGLPLVEFDKNIGFSKNQLHPVTGEQTSRLFSADQQKINGEIFGWHPNRGKGEYIQQRMSAIFVDTMKKILDTY